MNKDTIFNVMLKHFTARAITKGFLYAFLISVVLSGLLGVFYAIFFESMIIKTASEATLSEYLQHEPTVVELLFVLIAIFMGLSVGAYKTYMLSESKEIWHLIVLFVLFYAANMIVGSLLIAPAVPIWYSYTELMLTISAVVIGGYIGRTRKVSP